MRAIELRSIAIALISIAASRAIRSAHCLASQLRKPFFATLQKSRFAFTDSAQLVRKLVPTFRVELVPNSIESSAGACFAASFHFFLMGTNWEGSKISNLHKLSLPN